jgi:hypothetical protein
MTVITQPTVAATLTAGPFGALYELAPQALDAAAAAFVAGGTSAVLAVGDRAGGQVGITTGLNFTGMAALASAANTYHSGLSAAKRAQVGAAAVHISQTGFSITCHTADVATLAATLATILDSSANYGPVGT